MRKIYTTTLFVLAATIVNAQLSKGKTLLGGNVSFGTAKTTAGTSSFSNTGFNISPSIGKFYKENRLAGVMLNYGYTKSEAVTVSKGQNYGAGFFLRQYRPLKSGFYLFAEESLGVSYSKNETGPGINENVSKSTSVFAGFRPGISYAVKRNMQLELVLNDLVYLNYSHQKNTHVMSGNTTKTSGFNVGSSLTLTPLNNIGIGVKFLLGK